jgi:cytoskeletal protein CcmA (bactofilin family)
MADTDLTGLSEINALLGAGTEYEGKLVFQGRVRVDGRFVGEIHGTDVLILGATADVTASVDVGALIVLGGTLRGDVVARRLVELHAPGVVHGDIRTPQLFIDKGATFTGQCSMGDASSEVLPLVDESGTKVQLGRQATAEPEVSSEPAADDDDDDVDVVAQDEGARDAADDGAVPQDDDEEPFARAPQDDGSDEPDLRRAPRT